MRLFVTRWKNTFRAIATSDDGEYIYEVSGMYDKKGRLYVNGTVANVAEYGMLMLATARIIADAARAGMTVSDVLELLKTEAQ